MDDLIRTANGAVALLCTIGLSWVVLSRRVNEGLVVKLGLVAMAIGLGVTALITFGDIEIQRGLRNAGFFTRCGLLVVIVGVLCRARARRHPRRRASDFVPLGDGRAAP